jgi:hypothetical protein
MIKLLDMTKQEAGSGGQNQEDIVNYCHDSEIEEAGRHLGITDPNLLNRAFSIGEGMYRGIDQAVGFLTTIKEKMIDNKQSQPKKRLSKKQKQEILQRYEADTLFKESQADSDPK